MRWQIKTWPGEQHITDLPDVFEHPRECGGLLALRLEVREHDVSSPRAKFIHFVRNRFRMSRTGKLPKETRARHGGVLRPGCEDVQLLTFENTDPLELRVFDALQAPAELQRFTVELNPESGFSFWRRKYAPSVLFWLGVAILAPALPGFPLDEPIGERSDT